MSAPRPSFIAVRPKETEINEVTKEQRQESFHQAVGPALFLGQLFGMLPVDGVLAKDEKKLQFRWKSPVTFYGVFFLLIGTIESSVGTRRLVRLGFNIHFAEGFFFFITSMIRAFILFHLARHWKEIIAKWRQNEDVFLREPYKNNKWSLSSQIRVIFTVCVTFSLLEHFMFLAKAIEDNRLQLKYCTPKSQDFWQNFLWRYRPHLIYNFPYSPYELPLYEWVNLLQAFCWSYGDIFVILLATGIKYRFQQINNYFKEICENESLMTPITFRDIRIHYYQLVDLVYFIDSKISFLILLSLGHNMVVMIIKIFSALNPNRYHILDDIYFWFYIFFLGCRIFGTLLSCSKIHDTASDTIVYVRKVPSIYWTVDLKRLFDTITVESSTLTFSGQKFFFITKTMMLGLMGAIVTYELVLLDEIKEEKGELCSFIDY